MDIDEFILFDKKSFSGLLKDIYTNSKSKNTQISALIADLNGFIKTAGDAQMLVPLLAQYLKLSIDNDDHLIKLAAIAQRILVTTTKASLASESGSMVLTEEEKQQLIDEIENIVVSPKSGEQEIELITAQVQTATKKIDTKINKLIPKYDYSDENETNGI